MATVGAAEEDCDANTDACLQGTWQVDDYDAFLQAALDLAGVTDSAMPITYEGSEGDLSIAFSEDTITYSAGDFGISGNATTSDGITVSVTIHLEGVATAGYDVIEEGTIDLVEIDSGGFAVSGEVFLEGTSVGVTELDPEQWIFFISPTYGYACEEDILELTIPPLEEPIVLVRVD